MTNARLASHVTPVARPPRVKEGTKLNSCGTKMRAELRTMRGRRRQSQPALRGPFRERPPPRLSPMNPAKLRAGRRIDNPGAAENHMSGAGL
jgi:hypothetical protein